MSQPRDNARRTRPAVEAMYRFLLRLAPTVEQLVRAQFHHREGEGAQALGPRAGVVPTGSAAPAHVHSGRSR